jgi:hypothetical protein
MRRFAPHKPALAPAVTVLVLAAAILPLSNGAVVPRGGAPDLVVLFTGDVQGYVEPCG